MNAERFNDFLRDARLNLNPEDQVIFIYDGAPAHRNPENPGPNTEPKKLQPHSPFLNIIEQAISCLKAAIKADISRPDVQARTDGREEARNRGLTSTHSSVHVYFCKRYSAVSAVSPPRNALAGIDLRRLIYRAALMLKKLRAEIKSHKPEMQNHFYFENRFSLNACDKRAIVCKITLFVVKFALIVV